MLEYAPERGMPRLIDQLVGKLNRDENLGIQADNLMIVSGSTHAVDMIGRIFSGAGEGVLLEAPSYRDAIHVFRDHRSKLHSVPMDQNGIIVDGMAEILERLHTEGRSPRLLYTIPNFQNPTGSTIPEERRKKVIALSKRYGFIIVEDDVYRDIVFEGEVPASYFALAEGHGVLRIGSLSKTLAPGLRLGWLIGEPALIERCIHCGTSLMGGGANPFASAVAAEFCASGRWNAYIAKLQDVYRNRRDFSLAALKRHMPPGVEWTRPAGGFFLWMTLPSRVAVDPLQNVLRHKGVFISPGTGFFVDPEDGNHHLRLAYSFIEMDKIEDGIQILAYAIEKLAGK